MTGKKRPLITNYLPAAVKDPITLFAILQTGAQCIEKSDQCEPSYRHARYYTGYYRGRLLQSINEALNDKMKTATDSMIAGLVKLQTDEVSCCPEITNPIGGACNTPASGAVVHSLTHAQVSGRKPGAIRSTCRRLAEGYQVVWRSRETWHARLSSRPGYKVRSHGKHPMVYSYHMQSRPSSGLIFRF